MMHLMLAFGKIFSPLMGEGLTSSRDSEI